MDLKEERAIKDEEILEVINGTKIKYFEVSAIHNINIEHLI